MITFNKPGWIMHQCTVSTVLQNVQIFIFVLNSVNNITQTIVHVLHFSPFIRTIHKTTNAPSPDFIQVFRNDKRASFHTQRAGSVKSILKILRKKKKTPNRNLLHLQYVHRQQIIWVTVTSLHLQNKYAYMLSFVSLG